MDILQFREELSLSGVESSISVVSIKASSIEEGGCGIYASICAVLVSISGCFISSKASKAVSSSELSALLACICLPNELSSLITAVSSCISTPTTASGVILVKLSSLKIILFPFPIVVRFFTNLVLRIFSELIALDSLSDFTCVDCEWFIEISLVVLVVFILVICCKSGVACLLSEVIIASEVGKIVCVSASFCCVSGGVVKGFHVELLRVVFKIEL
jgi:hypothetical protein